ncbi:MAG: homocysteine S-methyltransferase family protein [Eubacteriales bacterium]|nr:homocysteine S-methyltransferase family protein [Eubacteriales bacterium]MDD4422166.1 homocysteine S-methyltransferase family protein [Eubacteriales bacterium]
MNIKEKIKSSRVYFDGSMGVMLQSLGLEPGELPENWNLTHPEKIVNLHKAYLEAGCNIISTNTFGANKLKFSNLDKVIESGIVNAKKAVSECAYMGEDHYVAFSMGPLGKLLTPFGDLEFEDAVDIFSDSVKIAAKNGVDLIIIETMSDSYETKAAVIAAKENSDLPVFVTNVYDENKKLLTGASPGAMTAMLEGLGVDAIGINCSLGPKQMRKIIPELLENASVPVIANPNAGLPRAENGKTVFDVGADEFAAVMKEFAELGVSIIGGCCGTTPEYIRKMIEVTKNLPFKRVSDKNKTVVSSYSHALYIENEPILIGERINPTGKPLIKQALRDGNFDYILSEALAQQEKGAHILDVNVGLPETDEVKMMATAVTELQVVVDLPLQIDTVNTAAMERAMRLYNGKPLVNSVSGSEESMTQIFPLVAKYGGVVVALTIDENGIPDTAEGRLAVAERIVRRAAKFGIKPKDIIVDPLALTVSSDTGSANITLESIRLIKEKLGVKTSLGISNISFGLPNREIINSAFYAIALQSGLDCAIINPFSEDIMKTYYSYRALRGMDENCVEYIGFASGKSERKAYVENSEDGAGESLQNAIVKGLKERAFTIASNLLKTSPPLDVIDTQIIPALDIVGRGYEEKTVFLPQLLMSAEAATSAFRAVKAVLPPTDSKNENKIILATVKGDIHDIGKNIVKVLLSNYGFYVIDLGKDVPPEVICAEAIEQEVKLVGLSALMTTTLPSMEKTIKLLRQKAPDIKVIVGGAVLTKEYADMVGADCYAKDAMEGVRYAEKVFSENE